MTMAICRWQTVEDGPPRDLPHAWGCYAGIWIRDTIRGADRVLHAVPVRDPITYGVKREHIVIRASVLEDEITATLEAYTPPDDGA